MYKVFNQQRAIIFTENLISCKISNDDTIIETNRLGEILPVYQKFIKENDFGNLVFLIKNELNAFVHKFFSDFKLISAAGGLIINSKGELLMIRRFSKWDLPKGKIKEGEEIEVAAIRECVEETGLQTMSIEKELESSYHIYEVKDKSLLKRTYWFMMKTDSDCELIPQLEEGIEEAKWMNRDEVIEALSDSYESLRDLISYNYLKH